jgi:DNA-binding CsgD family transcriptional regulator/pimeloyl-ACP methyl ester carboxylesterase
MDAPPVQYVTTSDGYSIAFTEKGQGHPLVFFSLPPHHILLTSAAPVRGSLPRALAEHFRLIQYDPRGNGLSARGLKAHGRVEDRVLDLEAVADRLGLDRFSVLACASTGDTVIRYALKHPEKVVALCLWNTTIGSPEDSIAQYETVARNSWDLFIQTSARMFGRDDFETEVNLFRQSTTQQDFLTSLDIARDASVRPLVPGVRTPTLVMATHSYVVPTEESAKEIASLIPGARLLLFDPPDGGFYTRDGSVPAVVPAVRNFIEEQLQRTGDAASAVVSAVGDLSAREIEVLRLLAAGKSNAQIAEELVISQNTVIRHVSNIFAKIGVENRTEAANYAHRNNLT